MPAHTRYKLWSAAFCAKKNPYGRCREATTAMKKAFPELEIVPGVVHTDIGERMHFWCKAPDGSIVDPTKGQFGAIFKYVPWYPGMALDVGACVHCGSRIRKPVYDLKVTPPREYTCSQACEEKLAAELNGEVGEFRVVG